MCGVREVVHLESRGRGIGHLVGPGLGTTHLVSPRRDSNHCTGLGRCRTSRSVVRGYTRMSREEIGVRLLAAGKEPAALQTCTNFVVPEAVHAAVRVSASDAADIAEVLSPKLEWPFYDNSGALRALRSQQLNLCVSPFGHMDNVSLTRSVETYDLAGTQMYQMGGF